MQHYVDFTVFGTLPKSDNLSLQIHPSQAIEMLLNDGDSIPLVFLITDGSVEDEREICEALRGQLMKRGLSAPRISTFGIGGFVFLLHL